MMGDFIKEALVTRDAEATAAMVLTICSYALVGPIKASHAWIRLIDHDNFLSLF